MSGPGPGLPRPGGRGAPQREPPRSRAAASGCGARRSPPPALPRIFQDYCARCTRSRHAFLVCALNVPLRDVFLSACIQVYMSKGASSGIYSFQSAWVC